MDLDKPFNDKVSDMFFDCVPEFTYDKILRTLTAKYENNTARAYVYVPKDFENFEQIAREILSYSAIAVRLGINFKDVTVKIFYKENHESGLSFTHNPDRYPDDFLKIHGEIALRQKYSPLRNHSGISFTLLSPIE